MCFFLINYSLISGNFTMRYVYFSQCSYHKVYPLSKHLLNTDYAPLVLLYPKDASLQTHEGEEHSRRTMRTENIGNKHIFQHARVSVMEKCYGSRTRRMGWGGRCWLQF